MNFKQLLSNNLPLFQLRNYSPPINQRTHRAHKPPWFNQARETLLPQRYSPSANFPTNDPIIGAVCLKILQRFSCAPVTHRFINRSFARCSAYSLAVDERYDHGTLTSPANANNCSQSPRLALSPSRLDPHAAMTSASG